MLREMQLVDGKLVAGQADNAQVLIYISPDDKERRHLVDDLRLDEHTLLSALDPDELPRLEFEPEHVALIFKRPKNYCSADDFLFKVASTGLFLFKDRLIIVLAEDAPILEGRHFTRLQSLHDLVLKILNRSIYHFTEHLKIINNISGELEQRINTSMENRYLFNMFTLEKSLVYYLNAISANGKVIDRLRNNGAKIGLTAENLEFADDITIENAQCYEQATIYSNILASLMDARASIVSNNLNMLMKTLNIITIGIMVPTFVVSAFSMNVRMPFPNEHPLSFWLIIAAALCSVAAVFMVWRYKKW